MHEERCDRDTQAHMDLDPSHGPPQLDSLMSLRHPKLLVPPARGQQCVHRCSERVPLEDILRGFTRLHAMCQLSFYTFYILW